MRKQDTTREASDLIASAMRDALRTLASEAKDAKNVVSADAERAAQALVTRNADGSSDHDTQIKLVEAVATLDKKFTEKFADLKSDIKGLSDGTANRISLLEQEKLNTKDSYFIIYKVGVETELKDHEDRIKSTETSITRLMAYGTAIIFLVGVIEFFISKFVD